MLGVAPQTFDTCRKEAGAPTYLSFGMPVFSASPLRFDSHHRSGFLLKRVGLFIRCDAQHTCFFLPVFSAIPRSVQVTLRPNHFL